MMLAKSNLMPIRIGKTMFALSIKGDVKEDLDVVRAILNGQQIDTSESVDPTTKQLNIYDIQSESDTPSEP